MKARKRSRPYGLWPSPVTPQEMAAQVRLHDLRWSPDGNTLVWLEGHSDQGVLMARQDSEVASRRLTVEHSVRARVGYGGGEFGLSNEAVFFVSEGRIYRQNLAGGTPKALTPAWGEGAAPTPSPDGRWLLFVHSVEKTDSLGLVDTEGTLWPIRLASGFDFYMQPAWHPSGRQIVWISWNHPNMPWDGSAVCCRTLEADRHPAAPAPLEPILGEPAGPVSYFQPEFSPDGRYLSVVSDEGGWWNLRVLDARNFQLRYVVEEEAEHAGPAWIQGLRTYVWAEDSKCLYYLRTQQGITSLQRFDLEQNGSVPVLDELAPYTHLEQPSLGRKGRLSLIASAPRIPRRILTLSPQGGLQIEAHSGPERILPSFLSDGRPVSWRCGSGRKPSQRPVAICHGLYYPPRHPESESSGPPPAVLKVHGGPTSHARLEYDLDTQFFTSRGFAVLELNSRGSSGYGRAYRQALQGHWGVYDVEDARSAADFLQKERLADGSRLAILGGSAGGFTVLLCLIRYPGLFRAGICRYGVSDLLSLASETHKFESHYLDSLIGPLPEKGDLYRERSPLFHAARIRDPLAIFQGDEDRVVPRSQSDQIVAVLTRLGIPHSYTVFEGEGHGWRKRETIQRYYEILERFLQQHLLLR